MGVCHSPAHLANDIFGHGRGSDVGRCGTRPIDPGWDATVLPVSPGPAMGYVWCGVRSASCMLFSPTHSISRYLYSFLSVCVSAFIAFTNVNGPKVYFRSCLLAYGVGLSSANFEHSFLMSPERPFLLVLSRHGHLDQQFCERRHRSRRGLYSQGSRRM